MSTRQVATTTPTLALGFTLGALAWQPSFAQRNAEEPATVKQPAARRYQMTALGAPGANPTIVVCDTATGQCWTRTLGLAGTDYGSPIQAKK